MVHKKEMLKVNPKMFGPKAQPCMNEMMAFLACLKRTNFNDDLCIKEKEALNACVEFQARAPKVKTTINYHLQRLGKYFKK
ncbi:37S ribosomal protein mrp10, mitochondrial-like [Selaginella moellendorffii]|uniref:37S ribosomal protein mrp10, mitochondrial-like n=1 Tax=Selaginella moellendorffii TaxID=88036 RepID=UPI000D1CA16C|nr:37S ribosomal protein mrp10, mitochondrial-like [Selaginella moellendorffii]|eukprot:XP_024519307.1 37S ribosomal protein mrp10, mitochondrial-like [Selaginella moellendorffii]